MAIVARPRYIDPFSPVLFNSPALRVTNEQTNYLRDILDVACSDSRFAEKAYTAILLVLMKGNTPVPTVGSLSPNTATIGDAAFDIHVHGTGFTSGTKIIFNGYEEPTTFVSATELHTGVNMPLWLAPAVVPVGVMSAEGVFSNTQNFTFMAAPPPELLSSKTRTQDRNDVEVKHVEVKEVMKSEKK